MSLLTPTPSYRFGTSQVPCTPPNSNSPNNSTWQCGSLFSPKVEQDQAIDASMAEYLRMQCHVVDSESPRSRISNVGLYPQGQLIFDLLSGRPGYSLGPAPGNDLSRPYWNPANSYASFCEPQNSLKNLSSELERLRGPMEKEFEHTGRAIGDNLPLAQSTPSTHSSNRAPSPNCRVTDDERERQKAEQRLSDKVKTVLCTQYMKAGTCEYGRSCRFAHGYSELRLRKVPANYKTVLCQNFERDTYCRYGKRCQFIHRNHMKGESADDDVTHVDEAVVTTSVADKKFKIGHFGAFHRSRR